MSVDHEVLSLAEKRIMKKLKMLIKSSGKRSSREADEEEELEMSVRRRRRMNLEYVEKNICDVPEGVLGILFESLSSVDLVTVFWMISGLERFKMNCDLKTDRIMPKILTELLEKYKLENDEKIKKYEDFWDKGNDFIYSQRDDTSPERFKYIEPNIADEIDETTDYTTVVEHNPSNNIRLHFISPLVRNVLRFYVVNENPNFNFFVVDDEEDTIYSDEGRIPNFRRTKELDFDFEEFSLLNMARDAGKTGDMVIMKYISNYLYEYYKKKYNDVYDETRNSIANDILYEEILIRVMIGVFIDKGQQTFARKILDGKIVIFRRVKRNFLLITRLMVAVIESGNTDLIDYLLYFCEKNESVKSSFTNEISRDLTRFPGNETLESVRRSIHRQIFGLTVKDLENEINVPNEYTFIISGSVVTSEIKWDKVAQTSAAIVALVAWSYYGGNPENILKLNFIPKIVYYVFNPTYEKNWNYDRRNKFFRAMFVGDLAAVRLLASGDVNSAKEMISFMADEIPEAPHESTFLHLPSAVALQTGLPDFFFRKMEEDSYITRIFMVMKNMNVRELLNITAIDHIPSDQLSIHWRDRKPKEVKIRLILRYLLISAANQKTRNLERDDKFLGIYVRIHRGDYHSFIENVLRNSELYVPFEYDGVIEEYTMIDLLYTGRNIIFSEIDTHNPINITNSIQTFMLLSIVNNDSKLFNMLFNNVLYNQNISVSYDNYFLPMLTGALGNYDLFEEHSSHSFEFLINELEDYKTFKFVILRTLYYIIERLSGRENFLGGELDPIRDLPEYHRIIEYIINELNTNEYSSVQIANDFLLLVAKYGTDLKYNQQYEIVKLLINTGKVSQLWRFFEGMPVYLFAFEEEEKKHEDVIDFMLNKLAISSPNLQAALVNLTDRRKIDMLVEKYDEKYFS